MTPNRNLRETLKNVPGLLLSWRAFVRVRTKVGGALASWYKRYVRRDPAEVVKANTKRAFDHFYANDTFVETDYLRENRRDFYVRVAAYCAERLPAGPARAIDVGCGTGHLLLALQTQAGQRLGLAGMDFSTKAIERARALVPCADLREADIYAIAWPDEEFDLVTSMETLEHLRTPEAALGEIARVCRPGGSIVLTVPNGEADDWEGHFHFWNPDEFRALVEPYAEVREVLDLPEFGAIIAWAIKRAAPTTDGQAASAERTRPC